MRVNKRQVIANQIVQYFEKYGKTETVKHFVAEGGESGQSLWDNKTLSENWDFKICTKIWSPKKCDYRTGHKSSKTQIIK